MRIFFVLMVFYCPSAVFAGVGGSPILPPIPAPTPAPTELDSQPSQGGLYTAARICKHLTG